MVTEATGGTAVIGGTVVIVAMGGTAVIMAMAATARPACRDVLLSAGTAPAFAGRDEAKAFFMSVEAFERCFRHRCPYAISRH